MNIAKRCKQLVLSKFDASLGKELELHSVWREAFCRVQEAEVVEKVSTARVAGRYKVRVPASSVATIHASGVRKPSKGDHSMLL